MIQMKWPIVNFLKSKKLLPVNMCTIVEFQFRSDNSEEKFSIIQATSPFILDA